MHELERNLKQAPSGWQSSRMQQLMYEKWANREIRNRPLPTEIQPAQYGAQVAVHVAPALQVSVGYSMRH